MSRSLVDFIVIWSISSSFVYGLQVSIISSSCFLRHRQIGEMLSVSTCSAQRFGSAEACLLTCGLQRLNPANRRSSRVAFCRPHPPARPAVCCLEANVGACELQYRCLWIHAAAAVAAAAVAALARNVHVVICTCADGTGDCACCPWLHGH